MNRSTHKSAAQLGLPTGDAVMREGKVTILPPDHALDMPRRTDVGPAQLPQLPMNAGSQVALKTTYTDRAWGFLLKSVPMWLAFVVGSVLIAYFWRDVPLISATMIGYMFTGAIISWLISWVLDMAISPDGTTIIQSLLAFRIVAREQQHRHDIERGDA